MDDLLSQRGGLTRLSSVQLERNFFTSAGIDALKRSAIHAEDEEPTQLYFEESKRARRPETMRVDMEHVRTLSLSSDTSTPDLGSPESTPVIGLGSQSSEAATFRFSNFEELRDRSM